MADERQEREGRDRRDGRGGRDRRGGRRFGRGGPGRRRRCAFCEAGVAKIDYKKVDELRYYLTERGKIKPRRKNATCAKHQRRLALAIKRARHLALLPFAAEGARSSG